MVDPPFCVGGETKSLAAIELLRRANEADISLLNEIQEVEATAPVFLGDRHDEAQVWFDQLVPRVIRSSHSRFEFLGRPFQLVNAQTRLLLVPMKVFCSECHSFEFLGCRRERRQLVTHPP